MFVRYTLYIPILFSIINASANVNAETYTTPFNLELNRSVVIKPTMEDKHQVWLSYNVFDENIQFLEPYKRPVTVSRITKFDVFRVGFNSTLSENFKIRTMLESSSQSTTRPIEPKLVNTQYLGGDIRIQWQPIIHDTILIGLEAGYRKHRVPNSSFNKLDQGNLSVSSAPGKSLIDSSAHDEAWLAAINFTFNITENFRFHTNYEYRSIEVQAITTSPDPLIQSLLEIKQAPQSSPWQEIHHITGIGFDWYLTPDLIVAVDYKSYDITRLNYQPRTGFLDYNLSSQLDMFSSYRLDKQLSILLSSRLTSNFMLGDVPALYNRRNNHGFKSPFIFIAIGFQYAL